MSNSLQYTLDITTVQSGAFRILIEALKEILIDANLEFTPTKVIIDEEGNEKTIPGGIKVLAINNKEGLLVHLKLMANNFNKFECDEKQILGVNMQGMYKVIKSMSNFDTFTLFREKCDYNRLGFRIENGDRNQKVEYRLPLIDVDIEDMDITPASFQAIISMSSNEFQKICRDMNAIEARYVDIKQTGKNLIFDCKGDIAECNLVFGEADNGISVHRSNGNEDEIIQGKYELKNLLLFTKCSNLCNNIEIFMKNDYPILIKYAVASLGYTHLCLSPVIDVNEKKFD